MPGVSKVWENCSSVSSTGDLNFCSVLTMLCGTSSRLVHVTVEPTATAVVAGRKAEVIHDDLVRSGAGCRCILFKRDVGDRRSDD